MSGEFDLGAQLSGQVPPEVVPGPPQTPEEFQQRKAGWSSVLDRINSDPNMQMTILRMGTRLMQPIAPGQTRGGHFAGALEDSVDYLGGLREVERKRGIDERKLSLDERKGAADITHSGAATAATQQATEQKAKTFPDVLSENQAKLKKLNLELRALEVANTPEMLTKRQSLEMEKLQLQNELVQHHANLYKNMADVYGNKGDKVQTHVGADGTVTTTTMIGGKPFVSQRVPAQETDQVAARARAEAEEKRLGGGWFGQAKYSGTRDEFIAKRTQELLTPRIVHFDPTGKEVKQLPSAAGPTSGTAPERQLSTRDKNLKSSVVVQPGEIVDSHDDHDSLAASLTEINGKIKKAKQGSPEMTGLLDAKKEVQAKMQAVSSTGTSELVQTPSGPAVNTPAAGPTKLERGPDGTIRVAGKTPTAESTAAPTSNAEINVMITNAAKGYQPAVEYLRRVLASGELNMTQRQRVEAALQKGQK